jgi:ABC-type dipeptide/oligopeptide/nickel transport system ATPase component
MSLDEITFTSQHFLDQLTILYGESGTGKSFVVRDIMSILSTHIAQIMVISPTDRQNHTYEKIVPRCFIHYGVDTEILKKVWARQEVMRVTYDRANNPEPLERLFSRIAPPLAKSAVEKIRTELSGAESRIRATVTDKNEIEDKLTAMKKAASKVILSIFKHNIEMYRDNFRGKVLADDESYCLQYLNFNPRLLIIFDDCTEQLNKTNNAAIMEKIFYAGRHNFITTIIACHTDKTFKPELKKQSFVNIFTTPSCAHAYFERKTNDLDKASRIAANEACRAAFTPLSRHQKLVWIRLESKFYRYTASFAEVAFCSPSIRKYSDAVVIQRDAQLTNNEFAYKFM